MCVRIWLRKQNGDDYEPTEEDYTTALVDIKQIRAALTDEDVHRALDMGFEVRLPTFVVPPSSLNSFC